MFQTNQGSIAKGLLTPLSEVLNERLASLNLAYGSQDHPVVEIYGTTIYLYNGRFRDRISETLEFDLIHRKLDTFTGTSFSELIKTLTA